MYMDDIKLCAKNKKELETLIHNSDNIQSGQMKMLHANNKKREMIHEGINGIIKSRKNKNARRNIESWQHQTSGKEKKDLKRVTSD